jgi:uncharacterized protein (DUF1330 family)
MQADLIQELVAAFGDGGIAPTAGQWQRLVGDDDPGRFVVVNRLKLRAEAAYPPGDPDQGKSSLEALMAYGAGSTPRIEALGGRVLFRGPHAGTVVGDDGEWDVAIVVEWPSRRAFVDLFRDAAYRAAYRHRRAAVERYAAFALVPL